MGLINLALKDSEQFPHYGRVNMMTLSLTGTREHI